MSNESIPPDALDVEALRERLRVTERKLALAEAQLVLSAVARPTPPHGTPAGLAGLGPSLDVLFHTAKVSMLLVGMDSTILRANQGAAELFGIPVSDLPGMRTIDLTDPEDVEETETAIDAVDSGSLIVKHYLKADGTRQTALAVGWPLVDDEGTPVCILGVAVPVSGLAATRSAVQEIAQLGIDPVDADTP